jgi:prevent-host-death family protein
MRFISITEFRKTLSELIHRVAYERQFFIVRRQGKPVAVLVPYSKEWARRVVDEQALIDDPSCQVLPPGPEEI